MVPNSYKTIIKLFLFDTTSYFWFHKCTFLYVSFMLLSWYFKESCYWNCCPGFSNKLVSQIKPNSFQYPLMNYVPCIGFTYLQNSYQQKRPELLYLKKCEFDNEISFSGWFQKIIFWYVRGLKSEINIKNKQEFYFGLLSLFFWPLCTPFAI